MDLMGRTSMIIVILSMATGLCGLCAFVTAAPDAAENAVSLYIKAAGDGFKVASPAESPLDYSEYPPFPPEWHKLAKAALEANADRLALARHARNAPPGEWPPGPLLPYLNTSRALANELGDAALFEHMQGNDAEAVEFVRDVLALGRALRTGNNQFAVQQLVGAGVEALAENRLMVMAPGLTFAKERADRKAVAPETIRDLIKQLLSPRDIDADIRAAIALQPPPNPGGKPMDMGRVALSLYRSDAERGMTAVSLACQLYRNDTGRWPDSMVQLVPAYLPKAPPDPFGRGSIGYVLVKRGLPEGGDRPLVYCGDNSDDGLFFRLDEPHYSFYRGDGSALPPDRQKQGGEFRDVARWAPVKRPPNAPTTQPLGEPLS